MDSIEGITRGPGIEEGLAARVHDPLWMLARQWQFGEFTHENAASPAWVDVTTEVHRLDQWQSPRGNGFVPFDAAATPLEKLVEEHGGGPTPRLRLEGGLRWKRMLANDSDLAAFTARCPFPPAARPADNAVRARIPDGALLRTCLARLAGPSTKDDELAALGAVATPQDRLTALATDWLGWWSAHEPPVIGQDADAWDEHRFEHAFSLRSSTLPGVELRSAEYPGGRLDWSAVDAFTTRDEPGQPETRTQRAVPAPARFGGMPATRFWELEDAAFDPGSVDAAPIDLGRLMLIGFATVYGNDWFALPLRLPPGSLSRVTNFAVRDVFGGTTKLTQLDADVDGWNAFGLTASERPLQPGQERPTSPWFFLAPALPASLESPPTDSVLLLRDEMANVAWAVEALVLDDAGRPRDRFADWAAREPEPPDDGEVPLYRVATEVPFHWFPLLPEQLDNESVQFRLVPLTRLDGGQVAEIRPTSALLPSADPWVPEEEVPRQGVQLARTWQYARWHDGSRHVWQARRKNTGSGPGSSGLAWDVVEN
jgi:hypothetical protein